MKVLGDVVYVRATEAVQKWKCGQIFDRAHPTNWNISTSKDMEESRHEKREREDRSQLCNF